MTDQTPLVLPTPAPTLNIPTSSSTVDVRIIDPTCYGTVSGTVVFTPQIPGFETFRFPSYVFLITNTNTDGQKKHILFDLGMRKDWETALPPKTVEFVRTTMPFDIERNVEDILDATDSGGLGVTIKDISSVIWSHHHFDHRGDISAFPASTELVVGPGFLDAYRPTYPTNPEGSIHESELTGRNVREISDTEMNQTIGRFPAYDFFGDGSFYLLSSPGHTTGHLCALARVTTAPEQETFVFMGGDCAHHPAIFRPSPYIPLPREIPISEPSTSTSKSASTSSPLLSQSYQTITTGTTTTAPATGGRDRILPCPGQYLIDHIHPLHTPTAPFMKSAPGVNENQPLAERSISAMQEFDARDDVLVCIAHDSALLGRVAFYPERLNGWYERGWKEKVKWVFCAGIDVDVNRDGDGQ